MNSNGVLSLGGKAFTAFQPVAFPFSSPPLIAPFWDDFNPSSGGSISYRQTSALALLEAFHSLIMDLDVLFLVHFVPTQLFIATWYQVPPFGQTKVGVCRIILSQVHSCSLLLQVSNTLQVVLASNANNTVVLFLYGDIEWSSGAQIGFNAGDGHLFRMLPEALSNQTLNMSDLSNVGEPGMFLFQVDGMLNRMSVHVALVRLHSVHC